MSTDCGRPCKHSRGTLLAAALLEQLPLACISFGLLVVLLGLPLAGLILLFFFLLLVLVLLLQGDDPRAFLAIEEVVCALHRMIVITMELRYVIVQM